ncbi:glycosyltransferase family 9 protein [Elioraea sp.]|uniref:glycosyltransferase family 9 protein n=1 Tax=Elioraea sp. TaxID=2185103 RepID=UPI003F708F0F
MAVLLIGPTRLGDAILASGVLDWLLRTHAGEPVSVACGAPASMAFAHVEGLTALHVLDKRRHGAHWLALWRAVRRQRWRRVVDLRRSLLPWLLRAESRHVVPRARPGEHRVALAARALGLPPLAPRIWTAERHRAEAARLLPGTAPTLALGPGANWICKTWPIERFAALAEALVGPDSALAGGRILLVGSASERGLAEPVRQTIGADRVVDAFGLDVPTTGAALSAATLFVGNDSAMMHLAAAAGTRTVGLFGPTHDTQYGPWGAHGLTVRTPASVEALLATRGPSRPDRTLMDGITTASVIEAIAGRWPELAGGPAAAPVPLGEPGAVR